MHAIKIRPTHKSRFEYERRVWIDFRPSMYLFISNCLQPNEIYDHLFINMKGKLNSFL